MKGNIKVLSQEYKIQEVPVISQGDSYAGFIDHFENTIFLCSTLNKDKKEVTLLHEILHAIFSQLGFDEEHDNEHLINSLANSVYQVLMDNKDLFTFWFWGPCLW